MDFSAWFERVQNGNFDMSIGWATGGPTPLNFYRDIMSTTSVRPIGEASGVNWHRFASEEADRLLEEFAATADFEEQKQIAGQLQMVYAENAPAVPLFPGPMWYEYNTTRFEINRGSETRAFERVKGTGENAVDTWKQVAPAEKTVDSSNFEGVLLDLSNLRAESFVDRAGPSTGHDKPAAVIVVKFDDGKKEERVTIGVVGPTAYAVRPDQPGALKLEAGKYEAAIKKLDAIQ